MGSRAAECSVPHGGETGRWNGQVDGGGGSKSAGRSDDVEEVGQVGRGEAVSGLEC